MARQWHRHIYAGVRLPVTYYAGEFRDSDRRFPELYGYEVAVGDARGVPSSEVPAAVARFIDALAQLCARIDQQIPAGQLPPDEATLRAVVRLCAYTHGEWVRIHPFANGNGRTARVWANWVAFRYGLPPFVVIKPRPAGVRYAAAAAHSMRGEHALTEAVFAEMLQTVPPPPGP